MMRTPAVEACKEVTGETVSPGRLYEAQYQQTLYTAPIFSCQGLTPRCATLDLQR